MRCQFFVLKVAQYGQLKIVAQLHTVGEIEAVAVVGGVERLRLAGIEAAVGIRQAFVQTGPFAKALNPVVGGRIPSHVGPSNIAGNAAGGIGFGAGAGSPQRGVQINPAAAFGLPRIVDIVGTLLDPRLRPFGDFISRIDVFTL